MFKSGTTATAAAPSWPQRIIIAIDIDSFYVACEILQDPSLKGKPVGIQQKTILATCSYEARALGIGKLQNVKDAKRMCPQLILVNGEDLTQYRRYSRSITRLVKSIIWDRAVERLGMDELFCDVTAMVERHVNELSKTASTSKVSSDKTWFNLNKPGEAGSNGFYYDANVNPSLDIPPTPANAPDVDHSPHLRVAAHLAAHVREQIRVKCGFTTSAGIAHNKTIAKLVASLNKPALQTTWNPDVRTWSKQGEDFLADFEVKKLQGFGSAICRTISQHIQTNNLAPGAEVAQFDLEPGKRIPLPISLVRSACSLALFKEWFNPKLGPRLWALIHGIDDEPVHPSPEYPVQISTEDSHYNIPSMKQALVEMLKLTTHLLKRLQEELTEGIDYNEGIITQEGRSSTSLSEKAVVWAQYPTVLRLTVRQGFGHTRETTSTSFPIDAIDQTVDFNERAHAMVRGPLTTLLKKLLKTKESDCACCITILNICATNFTKDRPSQTIQHALSRLSRPKRVERQEVDLTGLLSSSDEDGDDLQVVITAKSEPEEQAGLEVQGSETEQVGSTPAGGDDVSLSLSEDAVQQGAELPLAQNQYPIEIVDDMDPVSDADGEEEVQYLRSAQQAYFTCKECGSRLFSFTAQAHRAYHEEERSKEKAVGKMKGKSARSTEASASSSSSRKKQKK